MTLFKDSYKISVLLVVALFGSCNVQQDRIDAGAVASRVHSQMQASDFAAIYRESAPGFKNTGTESQFVSMMQQMIQNNGVLKKAEEVAYQSGIDSRVGRTHLLFFDLEYEHAQTRERMTLTRSETGQIQLWKLEWFR